MAEAEAVNLQKERQLEQLKQNIADMQNQRRLMESRLSWMSTSTRPAPAPELLEGGSPSGGEKESGKSVVVTLRDIAELVCRLEENETDGSSVSERVDNILSLWWDMNHPSYYYLDAKLKNMDWIQILATFGLQVPEPVSEDREESFVHCILQWLVREG